MGYNVLPVPSVPQYMVDPKTGNQTTVMTHQWRKWYENIGRLLPYDNEIPIESLPPSVQSTVVLGTKVVMVSDGQAVTFNTPFRNSAIETLFSMAGLPALAVGEIYDFKAIGLTKTGFTANLKVVTLGAPTAQTTGAGSYDAGLGYWTAQKPVTDDAYNQIYSFNFDCELNLVSLSDAIGGYLADYQGSFEVYVYTSSVWVKITTISINFQDNTVGYPPSTYAYGGYLEPITITQAIGMVAGAEFGVKATSGAVTVFNEVTYETRTIGSSVSLGATTIKSTTTGN